MKLRVGDRAPAVVLEALDGSRLAEWRPGFMAVADPSAVLYDAFGVSTSLAGYLHPQSMLALVRAALAGKRHRRFEGRETQMPADFVLDPTGRIVLAHLGGSVGDDVPVATLLRVVRSVRRRARNPAAGPRREPT